MPWTVDDVDKHKKGLSDKQKKQWVRIANAVLAKCMKDGLMKHVLQKQSSRQMEY